MTMTTSNENGSTHESFVRILNIADRIMGRIEGIAIRAEQGCPEALKTKASLDRLAHMKGLVV